MTHEEEWRPVPGYEGYYEVSTLGNVRSLTRVVVGRDGRMIHLAGRDLHPHIERETGYPRVSLSKDAVAHRRRVHELVTLAFLGPRAPETPHVRHLDGNPLNNSLANLTYGTVSENALDRVRHGTHPDAAKTHCKRGHEFTEENTYHQPTGGGRQCIACAKMKAAERKANRK